MPGRALSLDDYSEATRQCCKARSRVEQPEEIHQGCYERTRQTISAIAAFVIQPRNAERRTERLW